MQYPTCATTPVLRWDKYENKQLYWIEEELEAEWERTTSKSRRQESEYQTSVSAASAFESSLAPMNFMPDGAGAGPEGQGQQSYII